MYACKTAHRTVDVDDAGSMTDEAFGSADDVVESHTQAYSVDDLEHVSRVQR